MLCKAKTHLSLSPTLSCLSSALKLESNPKNKLHSNKESLNHSSSSTFHCKFWLQHKQKMPRPGPRPYECVRRAWHSERHQPMRGSIISQIFRVVTEAHSSSTRKNREWQEKLPTVVIKAEEIMYSKANSEAEYLDTDTLWDRLNDAIDTIIRKEETIETGDCLQPCIEAALVLGCVAVKASRNERLRNPRNYLHHHHHQDSAPRATALSEKQAIPYSTSIAPNNQFSIARPTKQTVPNNERDIMPTPVVYPLRYSSTGYQNMISHPGIHIRPNQNPSNVIVGTPVGWSSAQPSHFGSTRELFPSADKLRQDNQANSTSRLASATECDLSLRLGRNSDDHLDVTATLRKRKLPFSHDADERYFSQQPQRRPSQFPGQNRWQGL